MSYMEPVIPEKPEIADDPTAAEEILVCAESYLRQADHLIYSYGSRTFLSGYHIFDAEYENRGNIDCSSFVLLVLAQIPYEESPYATGTIVDLKSRMKRNLPKEVIDFSDLPDRYVGIAERIGRPYLAGPRGLDLNKAEEMGISLETLKEEIRAVGGRRLSASLAQYYIDQGACFLDADFAKPGDIAFFRSKGFFKEGDRIFAVNREVTHVGIIARDPSQMINSSGTYQKAEDKKTSPAVSLVPLFGTREPAFFARPT